jgi:hypothetical protein
VRRHERSLCRHLESLHADVVERRDSALPT